MNGIARAVLLLGFVTEQDRCANILRKVPDDMAPRMIPWWAWTAYLTAAITATRIARIRFPA